MRLLGQAGFEVWDREKAGANPSWNILFSQQEQWKSECTAVSSAALEMAPDQPRGHDTLGNINPVRTSYAKFTWPLAQLPGSTSAPWMEKLILFHSVCNSPNSHDFFPLYFYQKKKEKERKHQNG